MAKITASQKVKLFSDEDKQGHQSVSIDTEDKCGTWLTVAHDGNEITLSLENWERLTQLVDKAKQKLNL
jgi:hypothetical protein